MSVIQIKTPGLIAVRDECGKLTIGGDQYWYPSEGFLPPGACGATTASNVLAYLLRSRPELFCIMQKTGLVGLEAPFHDSNNPYEDSPAPNTKAGYLSFMKKVYRFLYPRLGGLMVEGFLEGMSELAHEYELPITTEFMRAPIGRSRRPSFSEVAGFLRSSLGSDIPVAFLILSNGCVENLDTWHWVTVLALDEETKRVKILDNTEVFWADLCVWLETSIMGGSFVRLLKR